MNFKATVYECIKSNGKSETILSFRKQAKPKPVVSVVLKKDPQESDDKTLDSWEDLGWGDNTQDSSKVLVSDPKEVLVNVPKEVLMNGPKEVLMNVPKEVLVNVPKEVFAPEKKLNRKEMKALLKQEKTETLLKQDKTEALPKQEKTKALPKQVSEEWLCEKIKNPELKSSKTSKEKNQDRINRREQEAKEKRRLEKIQEEKYLIQEEEPSLVHKKEPSKMQVTQEKTTKEHVWTDSNWEVVKSKPRLITNNFEQKQSKPSQTQTKPGNEKTKTCKGWEAGSCQYGVNCWFAHNVIEDKTDYEKTDYEKTKTCKGWKAGTCKFGKQCRFAHCDITNRKPKPESSESNKIDFGMLIDQALKSKPRTNSVVAPVVAPVVASCVAPVVAPVVAYADTPIVAHIAKLYKDKGKLIKGPEPVYEAIVHKVVKPNLVPSTPAINRTNVKDLSGNNLNLGSILKKTPALEKRTSVFKQPTSALEQRTFVLKQPTPLSPEQGKRNFGILFNKGTKLMEESLCKSRDDIIVGLKHLIGETIVFNLGDISKPIVINGVEYFFERLFRNPTFQSVVQEQVNTLISNTAEIIFNCRQIRKEEYILRIKNKNVM